MKEIRISNTTVGAGHPLMIIAEVGINHNGDFATACELLRQAHGDNAD